MLMDDRTLNELPPGEYAAWWDDMQERINRFNDDDRMPWSSYTAELKVFAGEPQITIHSPHGIAVDTFTNVEEFETYVDEVRSRWTT